MRLSEMMSEEEYKELENELEYVRTIKDSAEKTLKEVREENRLLKNEIAWMKDHTKYNSITKEEYIDGTMTATEAKLRLQQAEDIQKYVSRLEEENKKLKEELKKDNREVQVDVDKELLKANDYLIKENKKLKEDNRFLTKVCKEYMEKENIIEISEFADLYRDDLEKENKKLREKIRFLEQCLDNKEKVNKSLREEIEELKVPQYTHGEPVVSSGRCL